MKETQFKIIVEEITMNGFVSRNWALRKFISRLAPLICILRKNGYVITGEKKDGDFVYKLKTINVN